MLNDMPQSARDGLHCLASGEVLFEAGSTGQPWQLESGALRLDRIEREGPRFLQIVLPGDIIGLELLAALPHAFSARAIVPSRVRRKPLVGEAERRVALLEGMLQLQQRTADLVALRSGAAQDRLKHLLLLLAGDEQPWDSPGVQCDLPTIKDVAAIIDTAPETVSRIFANLRRSRLLDSRQRQGARFSVTRLREQEWPAGMTRSDTAVRGLALTPI
jgi:CRP-like cAMP-binding protein